MALETIDPKAERVNTFFFLDGPFTVPTVCMVRATAHIMWVVRLI